MKCCENITTPFCPQCGTDLEEPLNQLIKHVQGMVNHSEGVYQRQLAWAKAHPDVSGTYRYSHKRESRRRMIKKYKRWLHYLESQKNG